MSPLDMPPEINANGTRTEVRFEMARKQSDDAFFKELLSEPKFEKKNTNSITVRDVGQVMSMTLPKSWEEGKPVSMPGNAFFKEVHLKQNADVSLCFYYRGQRASIQGSEAFSAVLAKPDHVLTPAEFKSVSEIARNKDAKDFSLLNARTETINGKRVLVVEGRFKEKQIDTMSMYVEAEANKQSGSVIQEIYYQAPKNDYVAHLKEAKDAFKSIIWK